MGNFTFPDNGVQVKNEKDFLAYISLCILETLATEWQCIIFVAIVVATCIIIFEFLTRPPIKPRTLFSPYSKNTINLNLK